MRMPVACPLPLVVPLQMSSARAVSTATVCERVKAVV